MSQRADLGRVENPPDCPRKPPKKRKKPLQGPLRGTPCKKPPNASISLPWLSQQPSAARGSFAKRHQTLRKGGEVDRIRVRHIMEGLESRAQPREPKGRSDPHLWEGPLASTWNHVNPKGSQIPTYADVWERPLAFHPRLDCGGAVPKSILARIREPDKIRSPCSTVPLLFSSSN